VVSCVVGALMVKIAAGHQVPESFASISPDSIIIQTSKTASFGSPDTLEYSQTTAASYPREILGPLLLLAKGALSEDPHSLEVD
jgi:hypothetical protein